MTCQQAIDKLLEYLDGELTPPALAQLEAHLEACKPCRAYLATYQRTRELVAKASRVDIPDTLKARLRHLLTDDWRNS